jgi:hypothetical protein
MYNRDLGVDVTIYGTYEDLEDGGRLLCLHEQWEDEHTGEILQRLLKGEALWVAMNNN